MASNNTVQFLLNDERQELPNVNADETLLDFLRLKKILRGTKEGCAEGDCGACTVLVGRPVNGKMQYETVNACIRFVASLHACHVVTVEHLKKPDGSLHAIQAAMIEHHGSQCGFCTPGIVMSLFGLFLQNQSPNEQDIERALQGNLCRCTGYEPIIKAALGISKSDLGNQLEAEEIVIREQLEKICAKGSVMVEDEFFWPANQQEFATFFAANPDATIVSGSTDVGLWVTKHFTKIMPAIFIAHLDDLGTIETTDNEIRIGATVSYTNAWQVLAEHFPTMGAYWRRIGGEQVRNMGTIGGNIANGSPISDTPSPLIALDAVLHLRKGETKRSLPLEAFFVEYGKQDRNTGEFVEAISIPKLEKDEQFAVYKISKRLEEDISALTAAFKITLSSSGVADDVRICMGGMAGTPKRATALENAIKGNVWNEALIESELGRLEEDFQPLSDWRASSDYRMLCAKNLVRRFYLEANGAGSLTSLDQIVEVA